MFYRGPEDIERTGPYDERGPSEGDEGCHRRSEIWREDQHNCWCTYSTANILKQPPSLNIKYKASHSPSDPEHLLVLFYNSNIVLLNQYWSMTRDNEDDKRPGSAPGTEYSRSRLRASTESLYCYTGHCHQDQNSAVQISVKWPPPRYKTMKCSLHLSDSDKPPSLGHVVCSVTIQPGPAAYFQKAGPNNCSLREPVLTRSGQHKIKPKLRERRRDASQEFRSG